MDVNVNKTPALGAVNSNFTDEIKSEKNKILLIIILVSLMER